VAPISHVLDAIGLLARNVEDCELLDAVLTGGAVSGSDQRGDLKDVRFAYAPRQHLLDVDEQTDGIFRETLQKLKDAGAELVEVDLGGDFLALANGVTWPIFFHDTMPAIREFLAVNEVPVSFEEIFAALGAHIQEGWSRSVVPFGPDCISEEKYRVALILDMNCGGGWRQARSNERMRCSSRQLPVRRLGSKINGTSMLPART
jgi:mandelamide amidase